MNQITHEQASTAEQRDNAAVDRFAQAMKDKLAAARAKGRGGWDDPAQCSGEDLAEMLVAHLDKGNAGTFEDVANFCMMLHQRNEAPAVLKDAYRSEWLQAHSEGAAAMQRVIRQGEPR